jgi:hypothetical protein
MLDGGPALSDRERPGILDLPVHGLRFVLGVVLLLERRA